MHKIIDLGYGEFALIGIHHSVDSFIDIMNRDNRVSQMLREYVEPYEDGESFQSFSGPVVNCDDYLWNVLRAATICLSYLIKSQLALQQ